MLDEFGLRQREALLAANDIDFDALGYLTDQDLKDLAVSLGHRRKLLAAMAQIGRVQEARHQLAALLLDHSGRMF